MIGSDDAYFTIRDDRIPSLVVACTAMVVAMRFVELEMQKQKHFNSLLF